MMPQGEVDWRAPLPAVVLHTEEGNEKMINDRQIVLAGASMEVGLAILDLLWQADIDIAAEVVTFSGLPHALQAGKLRLMMVMGWSLETVQPLVYLVHGHPIEVVFIHEQQPTDLPPTWTWLSLERLPAWTRAWWAAA
ncbi:MAG: hypothetical protein H0X24_00325 [Ktedonobacterales bacterium]|nr:hypothetical protein [Ktedonobacterales bacterium]